MVDRRGKWLACFAGLMGALALGNGVRADSVLSVTPPNGGVGELTVWNLNETFTRSASSTGTSEAFGTFTISASPTTYGHLQTSLGVVQTISPFSGASGTFTITGNIDVKSSGAMTFYGPTVMDIEGPLDSTRTVFNDSVDLSAFAINLSGTNVTEMAFMFAREDPTSYPAYYSGSNQAYVVGQLHTTASSTGTLFTLNKFLTASGTVQMNTTNTKIDVFAVSLPLPAPLQVSSLLLIGTAGTTLLLKRRRVA